jgi:predicted RNA-binding Zn ribbon-like protein
LRTLIMKRENPEFETLARPFPLRVGFERGVPTLAPMTDNAVGGVGHILAAIARAAFEGTWERIKICPAGDCQVAFFDESRNRSRAWCSMQVCGNRTKTRAYRARHPQT